MPPRAKTLITETPQNAQRRCEGDVTTRRPVSRHPTFLGYLVHYLTGKLSEQNPFQIIYHKPSTEHISNGCGRACGGSCARPPSPSFPQLPQTLRRRLGWPLGRGMRLQREQPSLTSCLASYIVAVLCRGELTSARHIRRRAPSLMVDRATDRASNRPREVYRNQTHSHTDRQSV